VTVLPGLKTVATGLCRDDCKQTRLAWPVATDVPMIFDYITYGVCDCLCCLSNMNNLKDERT